MMETLKKNIGLVGAVTVLIIGLFAYAYETTRRLMVEKGRTEALETTINGLEGAAKAYAITMKDSMRLYAAEVEDLAMTKANIEARYNDLLVATRTKAKDVDRVTEVGMVIHDTIRGLPVLVDSFGGMSTIYRDEFTAIKVDISKDRKADINYIINDSITIFNTQKKHSIFFGLIKWNETKRTVVVSHNPKSRISGFKTVTLLE